MKMDQPVLAYWDIRCLAESIRLMLHYLHIDFEDKRYPTGDAPTYARPEWKNDKFTLGLDFPNLPYWMDGNVKVTESWAITKHIARKSKILYPHNDNEAMHCDMLEGVIEHFRYGFINMCYSKTSEEFENKKKAFLSNLDFELDKFEKFIEKNGSQWLIGGRITYVDFVFCEALDEIRLFKSDFLKNHSIIQNYVNSFDELKPIKTYRDSNLYHRLPVNSKYAYWGGSLEIELS